jgi:uncharacterized protein YbcI
MEATSATSGRGRASAEISKVIAGIHREHYGRGAGRVRTVMGEDFIICFLEDIYTPLERTLIDAGRFPAVQESREAFQDTMRPTFVSEVERITERKVIAFLSQVHMEPDLAIETFVLEPSSDGGQPEQDGSAPR